jgi:acylphosphatase
MIVPARRYIVRGRVQGVGFRWFVQREAQSLRLKGWVRNAENGDVEVLASGDAATLERLRELLARGPLGSRVAGVEESDAPAGSYRGFEITN